MRSALLALLWANLASCYSFNGLGAALRRPTAALASPALGQARMIASLEADVLARCVLIACIIPEAPEPQAHPGALPRCLALTRASPRPVLVFCSDEEALAEPGFNDTWYAVSFSHELSSDKPFATRLWGEPLVLYRDGQGEAVCVRDVCPHRSAPLSMGEMQDGKLRCFYHGWAFGKQGACEDVPTVVRIGRDDGRDKSSLGKTFCATSYSVVEHDGMLWVWRGNMLAADARKLPPVHESSFVVDTTLDHDCDWSALVARGLDAPHLALHESSAIPSPTPAGEGTSKTTAHDGPVIVRHGDIFGGLLGTFSEEVHVVPIAQRRSRVLLRQRFPKTPLLSMLLQLPGAIALFTLVVQNCAPPPPSLPPPPPPCAILASRHACDARAGAERLPCLLCSQGTIGLPSTGRMGCARRKRAWGASERRDSGTGWSGCSSVMELRTLAGGASRSPTSSVSRMSTRNSVHTASRRTMCATLRLHSTRRCRPPSTDVSSTRPRRWSSCGSRRLPLLRRVFSCTRPSLPRSPPPSSSGDTLEPHAQKLRWRTSSSSRTDGTHGPEFARTGWKAAAYRMPARRSLRPQVYHGLWLWWHETAMWMLAWNALPACLHGAELDVNAL